LNELRWTFAAAEDLQQIADYLFEKTPGTAAELIRRIYKAPSTLKEFPNRGRIGKKQGTRELLIPSLPYCHLSSWGKCSQYPQDPARSTRMA
jgi:toxin ParE1/3/4